MKLVKYKILVGLIFIVAMGGIYYQCNNHTIREEHQKNDNTFMLSEVNSKTEDEIENDDLHCSLQDGDIAMAKDNIIVGLSRGYVFKNKSDQGAFKLGMYFGHYFGILDSGTMNKIFRYKNEVIYIVSAARKDGVGNYPDWIAIIQDIKTNDYKIIEFDDDTINSYWSLDDSFYIKGDKLYYGIYYTPDNEKFWRFSIKAMDLTTYSKETICNYDDLGVYPSEVKGEDVDSGCRISNFVIREDGSVALSIIDSDMMRKIIVYKNGLFTQVVENGDNYLIDYDMRGLYYVRPDADYSKVTREDRINKTYKHKFVMQTNEGEEKILLKEENVLINGEKTVKDLIFVNFKISDDYFIYIEDNQVVQTYDFNGELLMEKELIDWESKKELRLNDYRVSYYNGEIWNTALTNNNELLVQTIDIK